MKTIGIVIRDFKVSDVSYIGIKNDLFEAFDAFHVNVIGIPIYKSLEKLKEIVKLCDGVVLSGGGHFADAELELVRYLYEENIPTLGICLGMQGMAMAYNGKKERKVENHNSKKEYVHGVNISKKSKLYSIMGQDKIMVNSRHSWCIPETTFAISCLSDDGIIEGIEDGSKRFFIGVQWHPESIRDEFSRKLFTAFIERL